MDDPNYDSLFFEAVSHRDSLVGYAFGIVRDWGIAEDVVHEAFLVVREHADSFDRSRELFPWLRGITRIRCLKSLEAREREIHVDPAIAGQMADQLDTCWDGDRQSAIAQKLASLRDCLQQLNPRARRLLFDFYIGRASAKDLTAGERGDPGRNAAAFHAKLHRLRAKLRDCVNAKLRFGEVVDQHALASLDPIFAPGSRAISVAVAAPVTVTVPVLRNYLTEYAAMVGALRQAAAVPQGDRLFPGEPGRDRGVSKGWGRGFGAVAAALVVGAFGWWVLNPSADTWIASVEMTDGTVSLTGADGRRALRPGDTIAMGDHLQAAEGAAAVVEYSDGTSVRVRPESTVSISGRRSLTLVSGAISAEVAPRGNKEPFRFLTGQGTFTVPGTRLHLRSDHQKTVLFTESGLVHASQAGQDHESLAVAGGEMTVVDDESVGEIVGGVTVQHFLSASDVGTVYPWSDGLRLAHHWDFDSGLVDKMGGEEAGPHGGQSRVQGKLGNAIRFDGDGHVSIVLDQDPDVFAGSFWGRVDEGIWRREFFLATDESSPRDELGKEDRGVRLLVDSEGDPAAGRLVLMTGDGDTAFQTHTGRGSFPLGEWTHIAFRIDRRTASARLFINGRDRTVAGTEVAHPAFPMPDPIWVGGNGSGIPPERMLDGAIDELRIFLEP